MPLPISALSAGAASRASIARAASVVQRVVDVPASTGSAHLPREYDRDAVQIALDDIVARINDSNRGGSGE